MTSCTHGQCGLLKSPTGRWPSVSWTLAATAAGSLFSALVYGALAQALWARESDGADARRALRAFAFYWATVAAYQAMLGAQHALAAGGIAPFPLALGVRYVGLVLASAGIGALLSFFAYLRTGDKEWFPRMGLLYGGVALLAGLHVYVSKPVGVAMTAWSVDLAYARDFQGGLFAPLLLMLQLLPILGALWYLTLVKSARDRAQRTRILVVGIGVSIQLLSFTLARLTESPLWQLISRTLLVIVVAALVGAAYLRPSSARVGRP